MSCRNLPKKRSKKPISSNKTSKTYFLSACIFNRLSIFAGCCLRFLHRRAVEVCKGQLFELKSVSAANLEVFSNASKLSVVLRELLKVFTLLKLCALLQELKQDEGKNVQRDVVDTSSYSASSCLC